MAIGTIDDAEFEAWANKIRRRIDEGQVKQEISKSTRRIGVQALKQFKANTPVDTGGLRKAWKAEGPNYDGSGWTVKLINNKKYASFVENGHRQTPGRYVPKIHKRLKASWVSGQHFVKLSQEEIARQLPDLITPGLWAFRDLLE